MISGGTPSRVGEIARPHDLRLDQAAAGDWGSAAGSDWQAAADVYEHLTRNSNHVAAVELVPWHRLLPDRAAVLDLGCGAGWLTAKLSSRDDVLEVIGWDASYSLLSNVLPEMVALLGGDASKIRTICGAFTPLLLEDESLDAIVMASAFHHAERPHELLRECHRVLRSSGRLLLLNEVPYPVLSMLRYVATTAVAAAVNATNATLNVTKRGNVSSERILYDEQLGDHAMTMPQWRRVLGAHTFDLEVFDTGLPPYKSSYRKHRPMDRRLTHFFLQKR